MRSVCEPAVRADLRLFRTTGLPVRTYRTKVPFVPDRANLRGGSCRDSRGGTCPGTPNGTPDLHQQRGRDPAKPPDERHARPGLSAVPVGPGRPRLVRTNPPADERPAHPDLSDHRAVHAKPRRASGARRLAALPDERPIHPDLSDLGAVRCEQPREPDTLAQVCGPAEPAARPSRPIGSMCRRCKPRKPTTPPDERHARPGLSAVPVGPGRPRRVRASPLPLWTSGPPVQTYRTSAPFVRNPPAAERARLYRPSQRDRPAAQISGRAGRSASWVSRGGRGSRQRRPRRTRGRDGRWPCGPSAWCCRAGCGAHRPRRARGSPPARAARGSGSRRCRGPTGWTRWRGRPRCPAAGRRWHGPR